MKQPRSVTFLYGAIATALLLVIATVALVLTPPSAPSVAEFAPRAEEQIQDAPDVQSSRFGSGAGACAAGQACEEPNVAAAPKSGVREKRDQIEKARIRRCVGDPPRQIEDPQSPPCVNYWEGDNGGETARGVTRDEIRIGVGVEPNLEQVAILEFFNARFELYGRKLRPVVYRGGASREGAVSAKEAGAFAVLAYTPYVGGDGTPPTDFEAEAARSGIIAVSQDISAFATEEHRRFDPYLWTYTPPVDLLNRSLGSLVCSSLAGRPPRFGGASLASARRFAVLKQKDPYLLVDERPLLDEVRRCGIAPRVYEEAASSDANDTTWAQMQADGVTTVLVLEDLNQITNAARTASSIGFNPEWVFVGLDVEREIQMTTMPADQSSHVAAIFPTNKLLPLSDQPATWAMREGGATPTASSMLAQTDFYRSLLLIASGIQAAGPDLTPQSFGKALHALPFPNPGAGAMPYYQASVGFAGQNWMTNDVAVTYWSNVPPEDGQDPRRTGQWCFVERGRRYPTAAVPDIERAIFPPVGTPCR